jgi:hypothetical protein
MVRKGHSHFTAPERMGPLPNEISSFEEVVRALKLTPNEYEKSQALREWVRRNKDEWYVSSELLKAWGFSVKVD